MIRPAATIAVLAAALLSAGAGPAGATERVAQAPNTGPTRLAPGGPPKRDPATPRGGIRVESLGGLNPDSVGVLDESQGGLGRHLWDSTARSTVASYLLRLPVRYKSPTLRDLARRLLLTRAIAPRGLAVGESLVALRLDRLYRMGEVKGGVALAKVAPSTLRGARLAEVKSNLLFLAGDSAGACATIAKQIPARLTLALQRSQIVCQALDKQPDKAMLGLGLLREQQGIPDETWERLVEAVANGDRIRVRSLKKATPGHLALLAAAKQKLPRDVAETEDLAVLYAIATNAAAPVSARLTAGEAAAAAGALKPAELAAIYKAYPVSRREVAAAVALAKRKFDARARVRLYKAATGARNPVLKAKILAATWALARKQGNYPLMARVFAPQIADLVPDVKLRGFALEAARALYHAGEFQLAVGWYKLLAAGTQSEPASRIWPIARLATPDRIVWDAARLQGWVTIQRREAPDEAERRLGILHALLTSTGDPAAASTDWASLIPRLASARQGGAVPRLWRSMRGAAIMRRRGETILAALVGIRDGDLSGLDGVDLRFVLASFKQIRLTDEVRALAIEAALANQL